MIVTKDVGRGIFVRVAIAEDEKYCSDQLQSYLQRFAQDSGEPVSVEGFSNGASLVEHYRGTWDLLLLDVDMPGMSGLDAARMIRRSDPDVIILFITNLAQYAIRGYEVGALDYLLKPVSYYALSMKLHAALRLLRRNQDRYLMLPQDGGMVRLPLSRLYYVEAFGHQLHYHTTEGELVSTTTQTLSALEGEMEGLVRCHKSFLVNMHYVDSVRSGTVLVAGREIPVGRSHRKALIEALLHYVKGGGING